MASRKFAKLVAGSRRGQDSSDVGLILPRTLDEGAGKPLVARTSIQIYRTSSAQQVEFQCGLGAPRTRDRRKSLDLNTTTTSFVFITVYSHTTPCLTELLTLYETLMRALYVFVVQIMRSDGGMWIRPIAWD